MANAQDIGLALSGLSAGLSGQGVQFQQQLQQQRALEQEQQKLRLQEQQAAEQERKKTLFQDSDSALKFLQQGRPDLASQIFGERSELLSSIPGADPADSNAIFDLIQLGNQGNAEARERVVKQLSDNVLIGQAKGFIDKPKDERAAGTREFESLTEGLTPEQKQQATLIELGLSPRAVGSAIQTIASNDLAEEIGDAKATIKGREKFAEASATSRARTIDKGFERLTAIDAGVRNIDRAITALNEGAGVGSIESLFPSFTAASKALENVQGSMALDVVGATTFGALSKGELDLAKDIALPTGLDTPELLQWLKDKKAAQGKLRTYFNEQIQHLDQGGTVASFLRKKEREIAEQEPSGQGAPTQTGIIEVDF